MRFLFPCDWIFLAALFCCTMTCVEPPSSQTVRIPPFASGACNANKWCWEHPTPTANTITGIFGTSENDVWAIGEGGTILHYDGNAWTFDPKSGTFLGLNAIYGFAANDLWIVGQKNTILHYDGTEWKEHLEFQKKNFFTRPIDIQSIWGSSSSDVWIGLPSGFLAHFDGTTWSTYNGISEAFYDTPSIWGTAKNDVWVLIRSNDATVSPQAKIYHYDGVTWTLSKTNPTRLTYLWGLSKKDIWALGDVGEVLYYDGTQWQSVSWNEPLNGNNTKDQKFIAMWGTAKNDLWAVSRGIFTTSQSFFGHFDGVAWTWTPTPNWSSEMDVDRNPLRLPHAMWGINQSVWVGGNYQTIFAHKNNHWEIDPSSSRGILWIDLKLLPDQHRRALLNEASLESVWTGSPTNIWVGGYMGFVLRYDGQHWQQVKLPVLGNGIFSTISSIYGFGENDVWMISDAGDFLHYDGKKVTALDMGGMNPGRELFALWGTSGNNIWIGANNEQIVHYNGVSFTTIQLRGSLFMGDNIVGIWGSSPTNVWAISQGGAIYRYNGNTWNFETLDPGLTSGKGASSYRDLFGTGPNDIWAVGSQRLLKVMRGFLVGPAGLLHYDGTTWSMVAKDFYQDLSSVWSTDPNDIWISTRDGETYRYNGTTWRPVPSGYSKVTARSYAIEKIRGLTDGQIWAVGDQGAILHYRPGRF